MANRQSAGATTMKENNLQVFSRKKIVELKLNQFSQSEIKKIIPSGKLLK